MKEHTIESFTDYIKYIESECCEEDILFRGQQQDWSLIPKIGRFKLRGDLRTTELEMLRGLLRTGHPYLGNMDTIDSKNQISPDLFAFAQHNGMATRLLDWTLNPLAALWFAVRKAPAKGEAKEMLSGVVWVFYKSITISTTPTNNAAFPTENIITYRPKHVTPQITAQQGLFTIHGYKEQKEDFIPLEQCSPYCDRLTKIVIPGDIFRDLRFQLDRCGINESSMFPGPQGLCRHIEWYHTFLEDEEEPIE